MSHPTHTTMPDTTATPSVLRDRERLREIVALGLLEPDVSAILQDAVSAASARFGLPVALVSVVLTDAQHFAAAHGLYDWAEEVEGTPLELSFCRYAVESREPFIVEAAAEHPLVHDSLLVRLEGIRCYAGIPLISSRGHAVGSFCVIGPEDRAFSESDIAELRAMAAGVMDRLEARRVAA